MRTSKMAAIAVAAVFLVLGSACSDSDKSAVNDADAATTTSAAEGAAEEGPMAGIFVFEAATCDSGVPTSGSYFRMVQGGGTLADGPFVPNADSTCLDKTYSALAPGSVGLATGEFQPQPTEPFDSAGNGLAELIVAPTKFFGADFAVSTNEVDPASGASVTAPEIVLSADGTLSGDLRAVSVAWNGQQFNQGSPKPDGSRPGLTSDLTGTFDADTGEFVIEWVSQIVGGPFDGFSGVWHLEGKFIAS